MQVATSTSLPEVSGTLAAALLASRLLGRSLPKSLHKCAFHDAYDATCQGVDLVKHGMPPPRYLM
jgi:hypothetical protein